MRKKICSFIIAISILCNFGIYAQGKENKTHWAQNTIDRFLRMGIIKGYESGGVRPGDIITRAEFCAVINNICNLTERKDVGFTDIKDGDWYKNIIEIASNAEYFSGYIENGVKYAGPEKPITREEAAVIICKVFELDDSDVETLNMIADEYSISDYAKKSVNVLMSLKYIKGYPDGSFKPKANLTRAEAFAMLENVSGELYGYLKESNTQTFKNLTVNKSGALIENIDVEQDVFITAGVMSGEVTFSNVNVGGRVVIQGGGENSIIFENCIINKVVVNKKDGKISVKASGKTNVSSVLCKSGARIIEQNIDKSSQGFKAVEISDGIASGYINSFSGIFDLIKVNGISRIEINDGMVNQLDLSVKTLVNITRDAVISYLNVLLGAEGSEISNQGKVLAGKIEIDGVAINGTVAVKGDLPVNSTVVTNTPTPSSTAPSSSKSTVTTALSIKRAYMLDGKLYVKYNKNPDLDADEMLTVIDDYEDTTVSGAVYYSGNISGDNTAEFYLSNGTETIPFKEGSYTVPCGSKEYPVLSFATIEEPIINSVYASVYQCVYNAQEYSWDISIIGSDASVIYIDVESENYQVPDGAEPLQNGDIISVSFDGQEIFRRTWDQWSKIWCKEPENTMEMVLVEGGEFTMGDWLEPLYAYTYPTYDMNLKKPKEVMPDEARFNETHEFWDITFDERDEHLVKVNDFYIGKYEVTFEMFDEFCEATSRDMKSDYNWGREYRPAVDITWYDAIEFCNWLSEEEGLEPCYTIEVIGEIENVKTMIETVDGSGNTIKAVQPMTHEELKVTCDFTKNGYRLPTEAEYEYAAKGGNSIADINSGNGSIYNGVSNMNSLIYYAWNKDNVDNPTVSEENPNGVDGALADSFSANGYTSPVGQLLPNHIGAHDMSGNVWEWMWDYYDPEYYLVSDYDNPTGYTYEEIQERALTRTDEMGKYSHVLRGGCWANPKPFLFTFFRFFSGQQYGNNIPNFTDARIGFRLCRTKTN